MLGFTLTLIGLSWLGDNAPGQAVQVMIAAVLGAVAGLTLCSLVKITLCAAGAMLGLVIGLLVASMLPFSNAWIGGRIGLGAAVAGAVFGHNLGGALTIYASAIAGAYVTVTGLARLFGITGACSGLMPVTTQTVVVFVVFAVISVLAQYRVRHVRTLRLGG